MIDLHTHTCASDGDLAPADLVRAAAEAGLSAVAVTDHDTIAGLEEAETAGRAARVEVVRGIELTAYQEGAEMHILGLLLGTDSPEDEAVLDRLAAARLERAEKMVALCRAGGCRITMADVSARAGPVAAGRRPIIGRPHVAGALAAAGDVAGFHDAFEKWLKPGKPAFLPKMAFSPGEAIALIHSMGGLAALAHPGAGGHDELIPALVAAGLDAIEVRHTLHSGVQTRFYEAQAEKRRLGTCGGSDFHGAGKMGAALGAPEVEDSVLDRLKERRTRRFGQGR
jgi:3',5'-nucleoside bisphosphate phosphatase